MRSLYEEVRRHLTPERLRELADQVEQETGLADAVPLEQVIRELEELARQPRSGQN